MEPTKAMINYFKLRTKKHTNLVDLYMLILINNRIDEKLNLDKKDLLERVGNHDSSKYEDPEYEPYIWLTEYFRLKNKGINFTYPPGIEDKIENAWKHHCQVNSHHPEFYDDCNQMSKEDMAEMVCDWASMSVEYKQLLKKWVDENIDKKWKFNDENKKFIYEVVEMTIIGV